MSLQVYKVYDLYVNSPKKLVPIRFTDPRECYYKNSGKARLEPPDDAFFWGFSLQWDRDTPQQLSDRLGNRPGLIKYKLLIPSSFIQFSPSGFEENIIMWNAETVRDLGGLLELTVMLTVRPSLIQPQQYLDFAKLMRKVNIDLGVAVLLRFMHEMNGCWMEYGQKPTEMIAAWRTMTTAIRKETNLTAMVWSPNIGGGYPFRGAGYDRNIPTLRTNPVDFNLLDTDNDGQITGNDDPYLPYYPGSQFLIRR